jgi:hypothetical protein
MGECGIACLLTHQEFRKMKNKVQAGALAFRPTRFTEHFSPPASVLLVPFVAKFFPLPEFLMQRTGKQFHIFPLFLRPCAPAGKFIGISSLPTPARSPRASFLSFQGVF